MSGISLVTKGFIHPISVSASGGGGSPPVYKDENRPKPHIEVTKFNLDSENKEPLTEESFKVKSLKIIVDQKE